MENTENTENTDLQEFLKSHDFMRLGQAVSHGQWQSAAMIQRRMQQKADTLNLASMSRSLGNLRQAIIRKSTPDAKQILAGIVAVRVQLLKSTDEKTSQNRL
jgi:hypothetical protein